MHISLTLYRCNCKHRTTSNTSFTDTNEKFWLLCTYTLIKHEECSITSVLGHITTEYQTLPTSTTQVTFKSANSNFFTEQFSYLTQLRTSPIHPLRAYEFTRKISTYCWHLNWLALKLPSTLQEIIVQRIIWLQLHCLQVFTWTGVHLSINRANRIRISCKPFICTLYTLHDT